MTVHTGLGEHPTWCAIDHTCTAAGKAGEHRSRPADWRTSAGRITATRIRSAATGVNRLEITVAVPLSDDARTAREQCRHLIFRTHLATVAGVRLLNDDPRGDRFSDR